ncbi:uncharacterized protein LOC131952557 [Physella acuta]|uniref:uncharacterized protein LOC131952557 n=1 Tax=Physella acuta TaxID=109671 RepID=UPI0027DD141F|nr:uncharacterized protein LOC131952557 [Physella acuta]
MMCWIQVSLQVLTTLVLLYLVLPSTSSMRVFSSLRSDRQLEDEPLEDSLLLSSSYTKRDGGHDPWNLCTGKQAIDCFYVYFNIYARLRKEAEAERSPPRNLVGKRSNPLSRLSSFLREDEAADDVTY